MNKNTHANERAIEWVKFLLCSTLASCWKHSVSSARLFHFRQRNDARWNHRNNYICSNNIRCCDTTKCSPINCVVLFVCRPMSSTTLSYRSIVWLHMGCRVLSLLLELFISHFLATDEIRVCLFAENRNNENVIAINCTNTIRVHRNDFQRNSTDYFYLFYFVRMENASKPMMIIIIQLAIVDWNTHTHAEREIETMCTIAPSCSSFDEFVFLFFHIHFTSL